MFSKDEPKLLLSPGKNISSTFGEEVQLNCSVTDHHLITPVIQWHIGNNLMP